MDSKDPGDPPNYSEGPAYAFWCLIFFGFGGAHRIYMGKYGTGFLWLITFGLFGIGQVLDLFRMRALVEDANLRSDLLEARRAKLGHRLSAPERQPTLRQRLVVAARENGGSLSVTEAVAATGHDFPEVEEALREMVATGYVDVDNAPGSGVVIYRFTEFR